ncbi:hypothetical protein M0R45_005535 [Rubus argutus]|uniref:Uncharacterized protein n=1 Tax=Rubus argutus TaxID=59490 RepID=A0AAW1YNH0_RUBAR
MTIPQSSSTRAAHQIDTPWLRKRSLIETFSQLWAIYPWSYSDSSTRAVVDSEGLNHANTDHPAVGEGPRKWISSYTWRNSTRPEIPITTSVPTTQSFARRPCFSFVNNFRTNQRLHLEIISRSGSRTSSPTDGGSNTWQNSRGGWLGAYQFIALKSRQKPQPRWEKTVISLTFQAIIGLTLAGQPPNLGDDQLHHLHIFVIRNFPYTKNDVGK